MLHDITELYDALSEGAVIATIINHPEFLEYSQHLMSKCFFDKINGCFYWAIKKLYESGITNVDAVNLLNVIDTNKAISREIDKIGYLDILKMQEFLDLSRLTSRETRDEYKQAVNRVLELSYKRDLYRELTNLANFNCFSDSPIDALNNTVYTTLDKLTAKYITGEDIQTISDVADGLWGEILRRRTEDGTYGIKSKYPAVNEYFTYEPTELVLVSGRMKRGKSAFMMNEAIHKMQAGIPTLYIDTEMSDRLFFERMLANISGVTVKQIKTGQYPQEDDEKIQKAIRWLKTKPFIHLYTPTMSMEQLYTICRTQKHKMGLQFVIYDYIKSDVTSSSEQYNELGNKCDFLKNSIAGDLELAVLAGAQLNRNNQIADSDKLERYASVSVKWEDKTADEILSDGTECGNYKLIIKLNRLGEQMTDDDYIDMMFNGNQMRITQAKQHMKASELDVFN